MSAQLSVDSAVPQEGAPVDAPRSRGILFLVAGAIGAGLLTLFVFLARAGDPGAFNWPVNWQLTASDNGVLFQFAQDVFTGVPLDWSFSPQVYVFPEIPVSLAAYLVAGGDLYVYYVVVAIINNILLFLALALLVRVLFPLETALARLARTGLAFSPLVILPLIGAAEVDSYHLASTYYFGEYLMLFAAPAFFLVRSLPVKIVIGLGLALVAASNPLVLVFCGLPFTIALVVRGIRLGFRSMLAPAFAVAGVLAATALIRFGLLTHLQGGSPFDYMNVDRFTFRLDGIRTTTAWIWSSTAGRLVLLLGLTTAVVALVGSIVVIVRVLRRRLPHSDRIGAAIYLGLMPVVGILCTTALLVTHYFYFWPVVVGSVVIVLLATPRRWVPRTVIAASAAFVVIAVASGGVANLAHTDRYFGHRSAETVCLDESLPTGSTGYATYSDTRRLSLTSANDIRLIPIKSNGSIATWLTNLDYARSEAGTFFYLNYRAAEPAFDGGSLIYRFGEPAEKVSCGPDQEYWLYTSAESRAAIAKYYDVR